MSTNSTQTLRQTPDVGLVQRGQATLAAGHLIHGAHSGVGGLHERGTVLGWHPQTLKQPLSVHPQGYGAMLQQGTLGTLLSTADYFFADHTQLIARQGGKAGRKRARVDAARTWGRARCTGRPRAQKLPPTPCRYDDSAP